MTTREKFSEVYKKNAERMKYAQVMAEKAREQGNKELERKFRAEYIDLKSEIDVYALQIIKEDSI